ncbi:MAG TPA: sugar transferase [Ktedonobacterales bacterium]|nr:sugar transferase [Ktedonobacterales bacterium]
MAVRAPVTPGSADGAFDAIAVASVASLESLESRYFFWKRVLDVVVSAALLVTLSPVILLTALAVSLNTPGPVFFRQRRVGEDGVEFDMLKFRSMRHNVSVRKHQDAIKVYMAGGKLNEDGDAGSPYKLKGDSRITRVGQIIRKTSIDELPQLWNVLMGQMSMVGPRPPIPYELQYYSPRAMERLKGKPGITGPWQVYGRNRVTFDRMVEMDIEYLEQRSVWQDLKLIAITAPAAIRGGA